jgi:hypothetical protein
LQPYEWGQASVTYPDWSGTAQLDQRITAAGIEVAVGLDPERWTVVDIDIGGGEYAHDLVGTQPTGPRVPFNRDQDSRLDS